MNAPRLRTGSCHGININSLFHVAIEAVGKQCAGLWGKVPRAATHLLDLFLGPVAKFPPCVHTDKQGSFLSLSKIAVPVLAKTTQGDLGSVVGFPKSTIRLPFKPL